jgi:hypothetical protein
MKGILVKKNGEWMVKYDDNGDIKLYPLCPDTKKWSEIPTVENYIKENIEVVFDYIVKGEYCETKEQMVKNYFAKIKRIEHESL